MSFISITDLLLGLTTRLEDEDVFYRERASIRDISKSPSLLEHMLSDPERDAQRAITIEHQSHARERFAKWDAKRDITKTAPYPGPKSATGVMVISGW